MKRSQKLPEFRRSFVIYLFLQNGPIYRCYRASFKLRVTLLWKIMGRKRGAYGGYNPSESVGPLDPAYMVSGWWLHMAPQYYGCVLLAAMSFRNQI